MKTLAQRIAVRILAADYEAIRSLIPDDARLPAKYADWARRASEEVARLTRRGEKFIPVVVKAEELLSYCHATGQAPSYAMLEATAVKKAGEV